MNDPRTLLANPTTCLQQLQNIPNEQILEIALDFQTQEDKILSSLIILQVLCDRDIQISEIISKRALEFLQHPDNKVQEITVSLLKKLLSKSDYSQLANQILDLMLATILWDFSFSTYHQSFKFTQEFVKSPFPDLKNKIKIQEPMFHNKYYFTNQKDRYVQGLLAALELLLHLVLDRPVDVIEIIQRSARHQNKYVRIHALNLAQKLNYQNFKEIVNATIHQGLIDEALEVRMSALKFYQQLNPQVKDRFLIPLLHNCHTENLMEIAANISSQQFPAPNGPPILGLISIIRDKYLKGSLIYSYSCTTSRYYQIRCSGLQTLQTSVLFLKSVPNALPYKEILKAAQNCTLFETDPTVRQSGFSLMYHLIRLHMNEISEFIPQVIENCAFHLSDVPTETKELCAKILALLKDHVNLVQLLAPKLEQVKNKELAYSDYVGNIPDTPEAQTALQKSLESQGGKEKVISRHQSHSLYGVAMCFRYVAQVPDEPLLRELLQNVSSGLKYIDQLRHQILEIIIEGLAELKVVKRLPIRLLDECDILKYMQQHQEMELLQKIGEIVGPTILKGRL